MLTRNIRWRLLARRPAALAVLLALVVVAHADTPPASPPPAPAAPAPAAPVVSPPPVSTAPGVSAPSPSAIPPAPPSPVPAPPAKALTLEERIAQLTPTFPASSLDLMEPPGTPQPLRLSGVDLIQRGTKILPGTARLDGNVPLAIEALWLPSVPTKNRFPLVVKMWSHDGKITRTQEFSAGPSSADAPWKVGGVYRQRYEFNLAPTASAFSGAGYITLNFATPQAGGVALTPLQGIEMNLSPVIRGRSVQTQRYPETFGPGWASLNASFRLGPEAEASLSVPEDRRSTLVAVGVISDFSYGSAEQGQEVCQVALLTTSGSVETLRLEAGVSTAKGDYDFYTQGTLAHEKVAVFDSQEADYLSESDAPFLKHRYVGVLKLAQPRAGVAAILFRSTSDVILDIHDVVLIGGGATP